MPAKYKTIFIQKQYFWLLPEKAVFWDNQDMLLIADAHFGKVNHFRKSGLAVPAGAMGENAGRMKNLLDKLKPKNCIFLGDLFHSHMNNDWYNFEGVVSKFSQVQFTLIRGNHDIIKEKLFTDLGFQILDELILDGVLLTHHPVENPEIFNICGHIHPGVKLASRINFTEKLPCFFLRKNQLILPSFGSFTGKKAMAPKEGDRVFVVAGSEVMEVGKSIG